MLLLDTFSGSVASLLPHRREVLAVTWADDRTIEVVLSPFSDESTEGTTRHRIPVPPSGSFDEAPETADLTSGIPVDPPLRSSGDGEVALTRLTTGHRLRYEARRLVWDVEIDDDGGVLAALDGIRLEAWSPAGELRYQMPTPDIGCQILPFGDRVVTVTGRPTGTPIEGTQVAIHDRADGAVIREVPHPVGLAGGAGGGLVLLRDTSLAGRRSEPDRSLLLDPADGATGEVAVGGFSSFPVRRAPELLLLVGDTGRDRHRNKYVAHLPPPEPDAPTEPERLYPLDWEQEGRILRIRT